MASDEYQLMSRKELIELRDQLKKLKEGSPDKSLGTLTQSLQRTMLELIGLFRDASESMKGDSDFGVSKKLEEISTKIDVLIDQNAKLAEGIVTVADMVREERAAKPEATAQAPSDRYIPSMPEPAPPPMPNVQFNTPPQPFMPSSFSPPPMPNMMAPSQMGPAPSQPPPRKRPFPNFMQ